VKMGAGPIIFISLVVLTLVVIGGPLLLSNVLRSSSGMVARSPGEFSFGDKEKDRDRSSSAASRGTPAQVTANNTAVKLIKEDKNEEAIDLLEPIMKECPVYNRGRQNLAIAYNNLGLKQVKNPRVALDSMWRSYCLAPEVSTTDQNITQLYQRLKLDPKSFETRVEMADSQSALGCLYGAYAEYTAALLLREDAATRAKLNAIIAKARAASADDVNGAFFVNVAAGDPKLIALRQNSKRGDVDFGPYMADLQRKIKSRWNPPKSNETKKLKVFFEVARDGKISKARVLDSSGDDQVDKAGLAALKELGYAPPLPAGAPESVAIEFSFDYNVFDKDKYKEQD